MGRKEPGALVLASAVAFVFLGSGRAPALTVATFADPTIGTSPVTPMFSVENGTITGGWIANGLDLTLQNIPGVSATTYNDVILQFAPLTYTGSYTSGTVGAGEFRFYQRVGGNPGPEIFQIDFNSGSMNVSGLGGDNIFSNNGVVFTIPGKQLSLLNESFAFAFANQTKIMQGSTVAGYTATASFTSSADVPEPACLVFLAMGLPFVYARRRR